MKILNTNYWSVDIGPNNGGTILKKLGMVNITFKYHPANKKIYVNTNGHIPKTVMKAIYDYYNPIPAFEIFKNGVPAGRHMNRNRAVGIANRLADRMVKGKVEVRRGEEVIFQKEVNREEAI